MKPFTKQLVSSIVMIVVWCTVWRVICIASGVVFPGWASATVCVIVGGLIGWGNAYKYREERRDYEFRKRFE